MSIKIDMTHTEPTVRRLLSTIAFLSFNSIRRATASLPNTAAGQHAEL